MLAILKPYLLTFIPIFVAVDAIGNIPLFVSLVEGMSKKDKHKALYECVATAASVAIIFMLLGKLVLRLLGITIPDFQIAGGVLLFVIAVRLLLPGNGKSVLAHPHDRDVGIFPLGMPLITGPAVLTTTLIMLDTYGIVPTFISLVINMFIVWVSLVKAGWFMKVLGAGGARGFAKIMYILLAAIAVMMVRKGIVGAFLR